MELTIFPLCYHDQLFDDEMKRRECGDGVYVSGTQFRRLMSMDTEDLVVYEIKCGDRSVLCHVCGTHNGPDDAVYVPMWACNVLGCYGEEKVSMKRSHPGIGLGIKIKPHETRYADKEDPVAVLRDAFENYSCLTAGVDIPLLIDGEQLIVSILETRPSGPICIRGVELEVEIEGEPTPEPAQVPVPTDESPLEDMLPTSLTTKRARINEPPVNVGNTFTDAFTISDDPRFPGRGYRLGGNR